MLPMPWRRKRVAKKSGMVAVVVCCMMHSYALCNGPCREGGSHESKIMPMLSVRVSWQGET